MHFFALTQDLTLDTRHFCCCYKGGGQAQILPYERLYLAMGVELTLIESRLKQDQSLAVAPLRPDSVSVSSGLRCIADEALLAWPHFPARLGRISSRLVGDGFFQHREVQPLPSQLQALRARKPEKQYFRFAFVNGFGINLGDCTMGMAAFRVVLQCLREHFPSLGCDILFGLGTNGAMADLLAYEPGVERVIFQAPTAAEFAQYDGYFDFTNLLLQPRFNELPMVDWVLWWCGLSPQAVAPERKRNRGHIHRDVWQAVSLLLRAQQGPKVLFNPKASVALRTMPARVALHFALRLLEMSPEITLVVDQPLDCQHPRLLDLSSHIDSAEKFRALVGQMDGVVTVNSFASHVADMCAVPTVHMCVTVPGHFYPYYPFMTALNPQGYEALPAFGKVKVDDDMWESMREAYEAAWKSFDPAQVLALLREKIALRQVALVEPSGLILVEGERAPLRNVVLERGVPRMQRMCLDPAHLYASERLAQLTRGVLSPGGVCLMACAPDAGLALTLAERLVPHGELIVMEPRALLARNVETALHLAAVDCARVLPVVGLAGVAQAQINVLNPWSECRSSEWGNTPSVVTVASQTVDQLDLARCSAMLIQSPMPYVPFISGALQTLQRCRPFILVVPVSREQLGAVLQVAQEADYDFWAEMVLPSSEADKAVCDLLVLGVPRERAVRMEGFIKLELE